MSKIDWPQAQSDYVGDSTLSLAKVGEKYGVSEVSVQKYAKKHSWKELRAETLQRIDELMPSKIAESESEFNAKKFKDGKELVSTAIKAIDNHRIIDLKSAIDLVKLGFKLQDQALGLDNPKNQINIQNNNPMTLDQYWKLLDKDIEHEKEMGDKM